MSNEEYIAMKMLTRFKELRKEDPNKPRPDIGWMLELLKVVRVHQLEHRKPSDAMTTFIE